MPPLLQSSLISPPTLPVKFEKQRIRPSGHHLPSIECFQVPNSCRPRSRKIKANAKIPLGCHVNPVCHSMNRNSNYPQFVCMLYSPAYSSSYASTPRNFNEMPDQRSYFTSNSRPHLHDRFHSKLSPHSYYPDQQLNSSSRHPHPLSQRGQSNNSNNSHSHYSDFHAYPSHQNQHSQINNLSPNNSVHQEHHRHSGQNGQHHNQTPAPSSQSMPNQRQYSQTDTAFPFPPVNDPTSPIRDSIQPVTNNAILLERSDYIDRPMHYIEPLITISKAAQAIVRPWLVNPSL